MSLRPEKDRLTVAVHDRQDWKEWITIDKWDKYQVSHSVWEDCGRFSIDPTPSWDMLKLFRYPGQGIEIYCNDHPQMTGVVEDIDAGAHARGKNLSLSGRDNCGLVVDSSAPRIPISGLTFRQMLEKLLQPWYPERIAGITTNNAVNFYRMVGKKYKVYDAMTDPGWAQGDAVRWMPRQAAVINPGAQSVKAGIFTTAIPVPKIKFRDITRWKVKGGVNSPYFAGTEEPNLKRIRGGEKVMDIIKDACKSVACFAGMSPDAWFTVAKPRYGEQPYEKLVFKQKGNTNVKGVERRVSISDRFSMYLAYGKGKKKRGTKGRDNRHSYGAFDPSPAFWRQNSAGDLVQLLYKPCLFEARRGSKNSQMLRRLVRTKMEEAACKALTYNWTVIGHHDPGTGILYAPDACIEVQDEVFGVSGLMYIVSRNFIRGRDGGTYTDLRLIPANIWMFDSADLNDKEYAELLKWKIDW